MSEQSLQRCVSDLLTHPHEQLSAGQVVVVIRENVRQLLKRLHAVSAGKHTATQHTIAPRDAAVRSNLKGNLFVSTSCVVYRLLCSFPGYLLVHAGPQPLQPVQRVGLQRRHDGSQGREVLAYSTLLLGQNIDAPVSGGPADEGEPAWAGLRRPERCQPSAG